ncbi:WD repeat domain 21 isoform X2 [Hypanus sabinus]|uniref:WD repeat domain 21 isoform X2 n=1 Tax=Hypanus sabinus TaxID=79690 RepID=UPI0028C4DF55|nr:WD repeat domain 21 isoform X2 [Hypanus sabinus]
MRVRIGLAAEMESNKWHRRRQFTHHDQRRHNQQRYRAYYGHRNQQHDSSESSEQNSSSMSAGEPTNSTSLPPDVPELPGFYYDREKNRYFRLLPGHNNCNPLTWEAINQKEMEEKRLKMLAEDASNTRVARTGMDFISLYCKRHCGLMNLQSYHRHVHELKISRMRRNTLKIQNSESSSTSNFGMILADTNCERLFVVKNDETGYKYGIVNLEGCRKGSGLISVTLCDNLYTTFRKGTSVCWASLSGHDSHVLLCLTGHADTPGSVSLLPSSIFSNSSMEEQPRMMCNFKSSTVWTCTWCYNPQADKCFSTGLLHRVFVTDAVTGQKQIFSTNSDVLAQQFARRVPVLYNGCRSGEIFSIDIRQQRRKGQSWKCTNFFHNSAVTCIRLLQDENYLIAADMIGEIKLWDLRTARCVKQYEGHYNKHAQLPIHINEEVGVLLAVGQDHYTRIWSLKDGCLLRTIPSPHPGSSDSIPSIAFSSQLGGSRGVPGLIMAVKQDLYHYTYNTDLQRA